MKRSDLLIFWGISYSKFKENVSEIALIMDTPFVETLLVLAGFISNAENVSKMSPETSRSVPETSLGPGVPAPTHVDN